MAQNPRRQLSVVYVLRYMVNSKQMYEFFFSLYNSNYQHSELISRCVADAKIKTDLSIWELCSHSGKVVIAGLPCRNVCAHVVDTNVSKDSHSWTRRPYVPLKHRYLPDWPSIIFLKFLAFSVPQFVFYSSFGIRISSILSKCSSHFYW
jgi:hypothetical protein